MGDDWTIGFRPVVLGCFVEVDLFWGSFGGKLRWTLLVLGAVVVGVLSTVTCVEF